MLIDLTVKITPQLVKEAQAQDKFALMGHLGTHFDIMDKEFPLDYLELPGRVFDVSSVEGLEIGINDVDLNAVEERSFVAFYSGHIENTGYGAPAYHHDHPQLSKELIEGLLARKVAVIGIDFPGVRRGKEHGVIDQYCANQGTFIVENLCRLGELCRYDCFTVATYPLNYAGFTGIPCRVIARV